MTEAAPSKFPEARREDVTDNYHGTTVKDPYRWLEDPDSAETKAWVTAQNKVSKTFLGKTNRLKLIEKLTKVWNYERHGAPFKKGKRYFYSKNDGLQNQSVVFWSNSPTGKEQLLLDPNALSKDGTVALAGYTVSDNGKHIAYGVQEAGSDWTEWRVREVATGKDLPDKIKWVKFSSATWARDNSGFYYGRYPEPSSDEELTGQNFNQKLYYHKLGTEQEADELVYERPDKKKWGFAPILTEDGKYMLISVWKGTGNENLLYSST